MTEHTKLPWYNKAVGLIANGDNLVIVTDHHLLISDAEFIVRACNDYDKDKKLIEGLVEALKEVMRWITNWEANFTDDDEWVSETEPRIEAALAKANE